MPARLQVQHRRDADGRSQGGQRRGNRGGAGPPPPSGGPRPLRRRVGRIGDLGSLDALPELVESGRRYLLDGSVGHDDMVDLSLRDALVATDAAHLQMRLDTPAVGFAQPLVDVPRKQLPNISMIGSRRIWIIHRGFEALNMSAAAIPPSAGSERRSFSRA